MNDLILKLKTGSKLYGVDHALSDDDYAGVFVESPELVFLGDKEQTRSLRQIPEGERSGPGDIDGQAYSVRHFFHLAATSNPSILALLFAPNSAIVESTESGRKILAHKDLFVSAKAGKKFKGYAYNQLDRMKGLKRGHIPARPELVEQYGFDVKYAMQVARLTMQGVEFLSTGKITLPMVDPNKSICLDIRNGGKSFKECIDLLEVLMKDLEDAIEKTELPPEPNIPEIAKLSQRIHDDNWMLKKRSATKWVTM